MQFLVVGLGNPGGQYQNTRHNIGFLAANFLAAKYSFPSFDSKFKSLFSQGLVNSNKVYIIKPQTFMNLSGESVVLVKNFYKIPIENIIVLHDEIDIPFSKIKTKQGGGAAGHNGLKSIDQLVGNNYFRVRIGVGRPEDPRYEVADYVLSDFTKEEQGGLEVIFNEVADKVINKIICV